METASLIVDIHNVRCGSCKVIVKDDLAERCTLCNAIFDRVVSNHVGLSQRLIRIREEAGIRLHSPEPAAAVEAPEETGEQAPRVLTASIVADIQNIRCANCKVVINDELAHQCEFCGAVFDRVVSNHVGLATKLNLLRESAGGGDSVAEATGKSPAAVGQP